MEDDNEQLNVSETSAPNKDEATKKEGDSLYHDKRRLSTESRKLFDKENIFKSSPPTTPSTVRPTLTTANKTMRELPLDMFLDYNYLNYDMDIKRRNKSKTKNTSTTKPALRYQTPITKLNAKLKINADSSNTTVTDDFEYYDDVHNLDPAAGQLSLGSYKLSMKEHEDRNIWYTPEKYPCWELPLIYGQPEKMKDTSEIFLLHPLKLKNIKVDDDDDNDNHNKSEETIIEGSEYNNWCGIPPCYGDHTLCLYPSKKYSKICLQGYVVREPVMAEQKALLMKLNSMRNRVAKGSQEEYPFLPPASNMQQITYDYDLERMTRRWLRQCLPGPPPCQSLGTETVTQLECTKYINLCCKGVDHTAKCVPSDDCFVNPIIGCLHTWFWDSHRDLGARDVECGHIEVTTYSLAQLLWAKTTKVGCAYGEEADGTIRVICSFAPGAPFNIDTKYYCGFMPLADNRHLLQVDTITDTDYLHQMFNIYLTKHHSKKVKHTRANYTRDKLKSRFGQVPKKYNWGVEILRNTYRETWVKGKLGNFTNGTLGLIARLVTRYTFTEVTGSRCDANEPIYEIGAPGAMCTETGRTFFALCYEFRDSTPGYRLVAILTSIMLFSLILVDLVRGVMRQQM
ncbi:cysteine-rich secretory protein family domain-containing protein [Phthorimaea operculella]|nr:cysteine-rich secretory protein family domain-containing protein [Phthorimaea operculella]